MPARHGLTCTLTAGGVHSVTVGGTGTGDYAVSVQRLDAPVGCSSLTYANATTTGAISPGEAECWRFLSNDGARLRVRVVTAAAALEPLVEVLRPDGTTRCIPTFADDSTCVLDLDGTHTLLVNDAGGATGGYSISIQRLNGPAGCLFKGFGATATLGTLATTGETDCFSVQGAVGNALRVRLLTNTIDPTTEILRPDGTTRCAPSALENRTCFLDTDGLHFVLVRDGAATNTGNYRISFQRLDDPLGCDVAPFGPIALSTAIATWGETDCYRFNVPVGSRVRARLLPDVGQLNPHAELIAPDGTTPCAPAFADKFTCPTIAAGVHTLLVRDAGLGAGNYRLALQRLQSPTGCATLAFGPTLVPAALSTPMETDCWRIAAAAGDQLRLEGAVAASAHVEVVRPDGTTRCQFPRQNNTTCALDTAGTHTVLIEHENPAQTGGYPPARPAPERPRRLRVADGRRRAARGLDPGGRRAQLLPRRRGPLGAPADPAHGQRGAVVDRRGRAPGRHAPLRAGGRGLLHLRDGHGRDAHDPRDRRRDRPHRRLRARSAPAAVAAQRYTVSRSTPRTGSATARRAR